MKRFLLFQLIFSALLLLSAVQVFAQKDIYYTAKIKSESPQIDARIDEPVWNSVDWQENFVQVIPLDNAPPSERTAFKILYDDRNLYVAIRAFEDDPGKITGRVARRDDTESDWISINIDSYFDKRTGFNFSVTPAGVKIDGIVTEQNKVYDLSYDPVWDVKTSRDSEGWIAEMRIPFTQVRFSSAEKQVWGINITRHIFRHAEMIKWPYIPENATGLVSLFGELHGLEGITPPKRIELLPYSVAKTVRSLEDPDNPFSKGSEYDLTGGLDAKIGVAGNLTLDLTVNPDFGQVEADPSEVNLTTWETFFEEKRPFFIEGKDIFEFKGMGGGRNANDGLFYSRRIGRKPQLGLNLDNSEYADIPDATSIISAMKLTGKTANGWSVGFLEAVTQEEKAEIDLDGSRRSVTVEPLTNYFVGRIKKDYDGGNTVIGGMVTATNRNLDDSNRDRIHSGAYTGGVDFLRQWQDKTYFVNTKVLFSNIRGTKEAIRIAQESPVHFHQRPDADYIDYDINKTSLSGHAGMLQWGKAGNGNWTWSATTYWRSPGVHLDDIGYLREDDKFIQKAEAVYKIWNPFFVFRTLAFGFKRYMNWNFDFKLVNHGYFGTIEAEFKNYWKLYLETRQAPLEYLLRELRGGPMLKIPFRHHYTTRIDTDSRRQFFAKFENKLVLKDDGYSVDNKTSIDFLWRPANNILVSAKPFYYTYKENLQYVATRSFFEDPRYIMGRIDQETAGLSFRLNYSITPDLTIQYYGQPFMSAGRYDRFKRITDPKADRYSDRFQEYTSAEIGINEDDNEYVVVEKDGFIANSYWFDNPDFNVREFRSNLVLRWEYKPGSVAYLVWSQDRSGRTLNGDFSIDREIRELFDIHPTNVFLLKLSYWFSVQ